MKTTLYLVRHGQSLGNLNEQMLGHTDLDLSELGYRQAAATFERLKDTHFDAVYSSPLQRAYNTVCPSCLLAISVSAFCTRAAAFCTYSPPGGVQMPKFARHSSQKV